MARSFICFIFSVVATVSAVICPYGSQYNPGDGMCYLGYNSTLPWASALNYCYQYGGELVVPHNGFENSLFTSVLLNLGFKNLGSWLGAYSSDNGIWYDWTGNKLNYFNWGPFQPYYNGSCASIGSDGYWFADKCDTYEEFICRIDPNGNAPTLPPTARPSTPTTKTTTTTTLAPPTQPQPTVNPIPANCPGYHTMNQTTPCSSGWTFYLQTCSCYLLSTKVLSWFEAEQNCVGYKSHLASVHSLDEAVFIKGLTTSTQYYITIGLQYNQRWMWTDGTPVDYLNFAPRITNPDYTKNPCGAILSNGYYFANYMVDMACNVRYSHSVCKKPLL